MVLGKVVYKLQAQCVVDIEGVFSAVLVGQCSQPESQLICVSQCKITYEHVIFLYIQEKVRFNMHEECHLEH